MATVNYDDIENSNFYYFIEEDSGDETYKVYFGLRENLHNNDYEENEMLVAEFQEETNAEEYVAWKNDNLNFESTFPKLADIEDISDQPYAEDDEPLGSEHL